jgi:hypothetical protein
MSQIIPIYIPTYISNQTYAPARVLPRLLFYNGLVDCEEWWIESGSLTTAGVTYAQNSFPYFDNYSVVTGSFPTDGSRSLLFNNEAAVYGTAPSSSLYTEYWDTYISLLYNPKTRLLNCSAIIPLADYVKMELNDIVNFRGNYYHLRAINDYSLKDGTCELQLLGPIIADTFSNLQPPPPPAPPDSASISWLNITDSDAPSSFRIYDNGSNRVTSTTTQGGSLFVTQSHIVNAEIDITSFPSSGSVTMSLFVNGDATISSTTNLNTTLTASFTAVGGNSYQITGSVEWNPASASCCTPTITSASVSGTDISIFFTTGSGCSGCTATTIQTSLDGSTWGGNNTAGCNSPRVITAPTASTYYRMYQNCGAVTSSFSNSYYFVSGSGTADLDWSYSETGGANGTMDLYINGFAVESRSSTASGTETVSVGDTIYVELQIVTACAPSDTYANIEVNGNILTDQDCANNAGVSLTTSTYTVVSGDIGSTLTLNTFASCDGGCL